MKKLLIIMVFLMTLPSFALYEPIPALNEPVSIFYTGSLTGLSGGTEFHISEQAAIQLFGDSILGGKLLSLKPELSVGFQLGERRQWEGYLAVNAKTFIKDAGGTALKFFILYDQDNKISIKPVAYIFIKSPYSLLFQDDLLLVFGGFKGEKADLKNKQEAISKAFTFFDKAEKKAFAGFTYYYDAVRSSWSVTLTGSVDSLTVSVNKGF